MSGENVKNVLKLKKDIADLEDKYGKALYILKNLNELEKRNKLASAIENLKTEITTERANLSEVERQLRFHQDILVEATKSLNQDIIEAPHE